MTKLTLGLTFILALVFVFFGVQKFGAENIVFETIAGRSGLSFFEPYVRIFTGIAELCTALLLLIPRTRLTGAFAGLGLLIGAIGFHLSPWLGINVPTIGHFLFVSAVCSLVISLVTISRLRKEGAMLWPFAR